MAEDPVDIERHAAELQADVDLIRKGLKTIGDVIERQEHVARRFQELRRLWTLRNRPDKADEALAAEEKTRSLIDDLSRVAGLEATDQEQVLDELLQELRDNTP